MRLLKRWRLKARSRADSQKRWTYLPKPPWFRKRPCWAGWSQYINIKSPWPLCPALWSRTLLDYWQTHRGLGLYFMCHGVFQAGEHRQMVKRTDRQMDATKRIISLASRSIITLGTFVKCYVCSMDKCVSQNKDKWILLPAMHAKRDSIENHNSSGMKYISVWSPSFVYLNTAKPVII